MELASCHPLMACNFDVATKFLENLWTPWVGWRVDGKAGLNAKANIKIPALVSSDWLISPSSVNLLSSCVLYSSINKQNRNMLMMYIRAKVQLRAQKYMKCRWLGFFTCILRTHIPPTLWRYKKLIDWCQIRLRIIQEKFCIFYTSLQFFIHRGKVTIFLISTHSVWLNSHLAITSVGNGIV